MKQNSFIIAGVIAIIILSSSMFTVHMTQSVIVLELQKPKKKQKPIDNLTKTKKIVNKPGKKITDICTILEKCSIDEISKYLVKQGKEKKFPDIAIRENK